ncbi:hypothetical protein V8F06_006253 [Rhypophila decipiens]
MSNRQTKLHNAGRAPVFAMVLLTLRSVMEAKEIVNTEQGSPCLGFICHTARFPETRTEKKYPLFPFMSKLRDET